MQRVALAWLVQVGNLCLRLRGMGCARSLVGMQLLQQPGGDMEVTLADGSQVEVSLTCCVPLVVCSEDC